MRSDSGIKRNLKIYSLSAKEIIQLYDDREGLFDLNSGFVRDRIIVNKPDAKYASNALTDQVLLTLDNREGCIVEGSLLTENLIYLDFEYADMSDESAFNRLVSDGLRIIFPGKDETITFVPFEKSASMAREKRISFINIELFDEVDKRLGLGIDWQSIEVIPSKYYAYRGLYMTDGVPISNDDLVLNEKTVIVIPVKKFECEFKKHGIEVETIDFDRRNDDGKIIIDGTTNPDKELKLKPYDGEGFISPEYAELIADSMSGVDARKPSSFQIRMPFTKGMLHKVNFKEFLQNEFPDSFIERLTIKDVFGIERHIADAQIILTDSMFKCGRWIKNIGADPMKTYFEAFNRYEHALYVAKTDLNLRSLRQVRMNYQFFSTLDMDTEIFDKIIERHIRETHLIGTDYKKSLEAIGNYYDAAFDVDEDESDELTDPIDIDPREYAFSKNAAFINDPGIKERLKQIRDSRIIDVMRGNVLVDGTAKFLSGDLLSMLLLIAQLCGAGSAQEIGALHKKTLHMDKFYLPAHKAYGINKDTYYGLLRSPHLSRNEQCAMRPYTEKGMYNRYFNHLNGVVMVSNKSYAPAAMGGADYDGDIVKIIFDEDINKAILSGAYEMKHYTDREGCDRTKYDRTLPVMFIDTPGGNWQIVEKHIDAADVRASFSSNVGIISNIAIDLGSGEYGKGTIAKGTTALCTVATGLEIDSVKTGVSPDLGYLSLLREDSKSDYLKSYTTFKYGYLKLPWKRGKTVFAEPEKETGGLALYTKKNKRKGKKGSDEETKRVYWEKEYLFTAEPNKEINIDRLPYYYASDLYEKKSEKRGKVKTCGADLPQYRFDFEREDGWKKKAQDDPRIPELKDIIGAYRKVHTDTVDVGKYRKSNTYLIGSIQTLLEVEYDLFVDRLARSKADIMSALDGAYEEVYEILTDFNNTVEAMKKMREIKWQYIPNYDLKQTALSEIIDASRLSESTRELLCDTYDNGYQILNYLLKDILEIIKENDDRPIEERESRWTRDEWSEPLYNKMLNDYKTSMEQGHKRSEWSKGAGALCRKEVLKLFNDDVSEAIKCTVAIEKEIDERHSFLWGAFKAEDFNDILFRQ